MAKKKEAEEGSTISEEITYWRNEIAAAKKREKDYRKNGIRILEIYDGSKTDQVPFNILFSNTQTLLPALYSDIPRPVVERRFKDDDPLGKVSSEAAQRMLQYLLNTNSEDYETFDEGMKAATLDGLLPGRGITSIKYDADVTDVDDETAYKNSELISIDSRSWNRVLFGYAKKWSKVQWIAYEEQIDKDEGDRLFGKLNKFLTYQTGEDYTLDKEDNDKKDKEERDMGERKTTLIYQIWDKEDRKVKYLSPQYADGFLKVVDDPLGLTGFFNCPRPLQFIYKSHSLIPTPVYALYENQAKELNEITRRISRVVKAIKAKAIYDTELGDDIKNLLDADDNSLVPADKSSSLAAEKGLQNAIWFWPIEALIAVLNQLYQARESCKKTIYEITGISDIIRGQSIASETLGAQKIKESWGTLRLQESQKEVQRYARDLLIIMLEIAATKFSEKTWAAMTQMPFLLTEQKAKLTKIAQAGMQALQKNPQLQQDPIFQQKAQQIQSELQKPVWGDVLKLLNDDTQRSYRIDIETNSTVQPEAVEDQKNISEVMTALGQFLNGVSPLVANGVLPFQAAQSMMLAIVRRFRFGDEIEDYLKQMQPPQQQDNGQAAEQQKMQMEQQNQQAQLQAQQQQKQAEMQFAQQEMQAKMQMEQQAEQGRAQAEAAKLQQELQIELAKIQGQKDAELAKLQAERHTEQMKANLQQDTELKKAALTGAVQIEVARINATKDTQSQQSTEGTETKEIMQQILSTQNKLLERIAVQN